MVVRPLTATVAVLVTVVAALAVPTSSTAAARPPTRVPSNAPDVASAVRAAKEGSSRVEVMSERTEFVQVFAEPSGQLTYEAAAVPQRVHRADGSWADIDLRLGRAGDGTLRPVASVADVRFSAGGKAALVTLVRDGKTMTIGWPLGPLPAPVVSGDTATYADVLPDIDLMVRATRTGFTHVLAVKTPKAAANPAIRTLRFGLGGNARATRLPDGSLRATAGYVLLARAAAPAMWDSSLPRRNAAPGTADAKSDHKRPGDAARVGNLKTEITREGDLLLRPDPSLLGTDATFPVFIDPEWSTGKTRWAYATSNNTNNTDLTRARVGADPDSGKLYRSFFEFPTTAIKGKHVESAYVQMKLDHSWSCTDTWTHMYQSGVISTPRTTWSTSLIKWVSSAASHANEGSGCVDSPQPDMTVNFTGSAVTSVVEGVASKSSASVTFGFSARNSTGQYESEVDRWKKFYPDNAKLIANVDAKPGKPSNLQVSGVACTTAGIAVGDATPNFYAYFPDADATTQILTHTWEFVNAPLGGTMTSRTPPPATTAGGNTGKTSADVSAPNGARYGFRVRSTDPAPYSITSPWSDYCYFTVDTSAPSLTVTPTSAPSGPGRPGTFRLSSPDTDVVTFRYGWTEAATNTIAATTATDGTKYADVTVTAPNYGVNVLYGQAVDATNNKGYGSAEFVVARPSPAVGSWALETSGTLDQASALLDRQPALAGDTPLTATNVRWDSDLRVIGSQTVGFNGSSSQLTTAGPILDTTKSFSVAAWVRPGAFPAGIDQGIVTQDSIGTQGFGLGVRNVGSPLTPRWSFAMKDTSVQSSATRAAYSATALTSADIGKWTHVAGVYDATAKRIRLYVNGVLTAEVDRTATGWAATGSFAVGRYGSSGAVNNWFTGNVADVQIFDRVLVADDFTGKAASDPMSGGVDEPGILAPTLVGRWDFETAVPCYETGIPDTCEAPDAGTGWNRRLALTQGTGLGGGIGNSQGLALSDVHWIDDPADPHFGEADQEYGIAERNIAPPGQPAQWQQGPVLRTDQAYTVSAWVQPAKLETTMTAVSQRGTRVGAFYLSTRSSTVNGVTGIRFELGVPPSDSEVNGPWTKVIAPTVLTDDDTGLWHHLVAVYDPASSPSLRLYVNGELAAQGSGGGWQGSGPMSVGRAWWTTSNGVSAWYDQWFGGIDQVEVYRGAMTADQVAILHDQQSN